MIVLNGYLFLNLLIGWTCLTAENKGVPHPKWIKPFIYLSVPWAVSIHTVTAFLYAGLPGRGFWLTAVMAPRFLTSAFAAGPALLILLALLVRKVSKFDPGQEQIQTLAKIRGLRAAAELVPARVRALHGLLQQPPRPQTALRLPLPGPARPRRAGAVMWTSVVLAVGAIVLLVNPEPAATRRCSPGPAS